MILTRWHTVLVWSLVPVVLAKVTNIVLFGDSYTDQSRQHSISNGTVIGPHYQEVYPPDDTAADGGYQWPWYLGLYGNLTIWNYAVGGAVCSNSLTPLNGLPDVSSAQKAWFVEDHVTAFGTKQQKLHLDPEESTIIIFIGTNDIGLNSFVTSSQSANVSLVDVAECQFSSIRDLRALGVKNFILSSLIPLHLTGLYNGSSAPVIYWPAEHDGHAWHKGIFNLVNSLNRILKDGVRSLNAEWSLRAESTGVGKVEFFDAYRFFEDVYNEPEKYFNGSIPADVTGHCHKCDVPTDWHFCGIGDCSAAERDSYMWWDELHPSEQTGRHLAAEMLKKIEGKSMY